MDIKERFYQKLQESREQLDEVTASIDHKYVPEKWGVKSGKVQKIINSLEKAKIPHSVAHFGGDRNSGITYVTSDHPKFASHMEKLANKADTYDPRIYVHGVAEPKKRSSKKK